MDLFGAALPEVLKHRLNYGLQLYYVGQVTAGQVGHRSGQGNDSDPPINPEEAKQALGLVEIVYHGIHNLDVSPEVQVPHEMLLAMNPSQIFGLYAGTWLLKLDGHKWREAVNRQNFWQVVGAARKRAAQTPLHSYLLSRLDELCGKTYTADEDGSLPARLQQLPQHVAVGFMQAFAAPFRSPDEKAGYAPVSKLRTGNVTLDQVVFGHFAGKFAEGDRQLSIAGQQSKA